MQHLPRQVRRLLSPASHSPLQPRTLQALTLQALLSNLHRPAAGAGGACSVCPLPDLPA